MRTGRNRRGHHKERERHDWDEERDRETNRRRYSDEQPDPLTDNDEDSEETLPLTRMEALEVGSQGVGCGNVLSACLIVLREAPSGQTGISHCTQSVIGFIWISPTSSANLSLTMAMITIRTMPLAQ